MQSIDSRPKRLLWIVNHKTLLPAEVPLLVDLGWEVYIPKIIPSDDDYRSGVVNYDYDSSLTLTGPELNLLNNHNFYGEVLNARPWSATTQRLINRNFDVIITTISGFISPLRNALHHFEGATIARVFGLEDPRSYADFIKNIGYSELIPLAEMAGERFIFGQGYSNLREIEPPSLGGNYRTITVPLPSSIYKHEGSWMGGGADAIFLCPAIRNEGGYYKDIYDRIKLNFGSLPHKIFGRQVQAISDTSVLPYLTDDELINLYRTAPVFVYPSTEKRHIHYSPIEAMVVGTPVLYMKGSLSDMLGGFSDTPGACVDYSQMLALAQRLIAGDGGLALQIQNSQRTIIEAFSQDLARSQWDATLSSIKLRETRT